MTNYILDTDIISYYLKGYETVTNNVQNYLSQTSKKRLTFSEITYFEILAGLEYKMAFKQIETFKQFASKSLILKLSYPSLQKSASFFGSLKRKGIIIGTPDLLIAGVANVNDLTLVTNNQKHFEPIEGLKTVNWNKEIQQF
ncbi:MAG: type II toxin-antitoxin system VapC family toxin [Bacteroidales bacterium]|nr:type II toxin-antitoxin system VapC family toxin [Bacteroidales bacterium]MCF8456892.1 type II toxin-antitoxin system VapC family toxin [Bacteroidales bacterium]